MSRLATASIFGQGYSPTAPSEWHYLSTTVRGQRGERTGLVYCHGSGATTTTMLATPIEKALVDGLAQRYAVAACDLGLQAWGSDTHVQRIGEAVAFLQTTWGVTGRVLLVAGSMGTLGALGYARLYPEKVRAVAAMIPALDLADLMLRGAATSIDAAYPPAYNDATDGPTHSPVKYASSLNADLPIHLWTCSDDTICVPATADAFTAARPQTGRTNLGALGHSAAAVQAATPLVLDWLTAA